MKNKNYWAKRTFLQKNVKSSIVFHAFGTSLKGILIIYTMVTFLLLRGSAVTVLSHPAYSDTFHALVQAVLLGYPPA